MTLFGLFLLYYFFPCIKSGYMYVCDKYKKSKKMKEIIAKDKSDFYVIKMVISTVMTVIYVMFISYIQRFINSFCIEEVSKNEFEIKLFIKNRLVKFRMKIKRGPSDILQILDNKNNDITKEIEPYFNNNIVNIKLEDINQEEIQILLGNGEYKNIKKDEILKL